MNRTVQKSLGLALGLTMVATLVASVPAHAQDPAPVTPYGVRMNTILGPTGLITVPTASAAPESQVQVGAAYTEDLWSASANVGIPLEGQVGVEVGAAYLDYDWGDEDVIGSAKVNIGADAAGRYQVGIGIVDFTDEVESSGYIVVSTDLLAPPDAWAEDTLAVRGHLGYAGGIYDDSLIGGVEVFLSRGMSIIGEYNGDDVNAALRFADSAQPIRIQAGVADSDFFVSATAAFNF